MIVKYAQKRKDSFVGYVVFTIFAPTIKLATRLSNSPRETAVKAIEERNCEHGYKQIKKK